MVGGTERGKRMDSLREALLEYAKKQMAAMETGTEFTVEKLFKDFTWRDFPLNDRVSVGVSFHNQFFNKDKSECAALLKLEKNAEGQQQYKRK